MKIEHDFAISIRQIETVKQETFTGKYERKKPFSRKFYLITSIFCRIGNRNTNRCGHLMYGISLVDILKRKGEYSSSR